MENRFQTSFIPKRPIVSGGGEFVRQKNPPSFFMIIGVAIFVIALALFGGLYFYKKSLTAGNEEKKQKVEQAIKNFDPELTRELTILKTRIDSSKRLLSKHVSFSTLLGDLEENTARAIRFTDLTFAVALDPMTNEEKMSLSLKGESQAYRSIAFQSDVFSKNKIFRSAIFSDINLNEKGLIVFSVKADVNPTPILYKETVLPSIEPVPPETPASTATTTSTSAATSTEPN